MSAHLSLLSSAAAPIRRTPRRRGLAGIGPKWGRIPSMVRRLPAVTLLLMLPVMLPVAAAKAASPAPAAASGPNIAGVFLTTKYPALTVRAGETTTVDLSVHNFKLPPQLLTLSVPEVASGWKARILGGGQPVGA